MEDLGAPSSYLVLEEGLPAFSRDGEEVGRVEHVLADPDADVFDGIVLDTSVLPGGHRFVDATQVDEIYERGVVLTLDRDAAERLGLKGLHPGRAPTIVAGVVILIQVMRAFVLDEIEVSEHDILYGAALEAARDGDIA